MFRDCWLSKLTTAGIQAGEGPFLVGSHQPAVAVDISRKDGGKTALDVLFCHGDHALTRASQVYGQEF